MSFRLLSDTTSVARKQSLCIWCGEAILKGEAHRSQTGIMDGEFQTNRFHLECHAALVRVHSRDRYAIEDGFEAYSFNRGGEMPKGETELSVSLSKAASP